MGSIVRVRYDEENFILLFTQENHRGFSLPEGYLPDFKKGLLHDESGEFFYQNYYIEKTSKTVRIMRQGRDNDVVIELTPQGVEKLISALEESHLL